MLIEKNIAYGTTILGIVLTGSEVLAWSKSGSPVVDIRLLAGVFIGSIGVYLGTAVALTHTNKTHRFILCIGWFFVALFLSVSAGMNMRIDLQNILWILYSVFTVIPLFSLCFVLIKHYLQHR